MHTVLWLNWIRQGHYANALTELHHLMSNVGFWGPMAPASAFGLLGRIEEGRLALSELLEMRPDFSSRGPELIGHFVKFPVISNRIISGLKCSGLEVE